MQREAAKPKGEEYATSRADRRRILMYILRLERKVRRKLLGRHVLAVPLRGHVFDMAGRMVAVAGAQRNAS